MLAEWSLVSYCAKPNPVGGDDKESGPSQGDSPPKGSLRYVLGWIRGFVLLLALIIVIYVGCNMWALRSWMDESSWLGEDNEENDWTFGQMLPMLILLFAGLAVVDSFPDLLTDKSD